MPCNFRDLSVWIVIRKGDIKMELSLMMAQQIACMMLMLLVGFAAGRLKLVPDGSSKALSAVNLYILCPAILISAFQMEFSVNKLMLLLIGLLTAGVVNAIFIVMSNVFKKVFNIDDIDRMSLIYVNSGNLIMPLIAAVLGQEYVFYGCSALAFMNTMFWFHGYQILSGDKSVKLKKAFLNPNIIAIFAGMVIFVCGIQLPVIASQTITRLADCIGPMSMLSVGFIMSELDLGKVFSNKRAYLISVLRLIVLPLMCILLIMLIRPARIYPGLEDVMLATMMAAAAPSAVMVSQMASLTGSDTAVASAVNIISTLGCIITLPAMIMLYQILCM